ncbi:von Willebrand factor type A domain protein [Phycisphaerae bacterium RAS1]|nr:von Willebrand factor type A domain protein [Phycisphaerae bacterium RAS1]
MPFRFGRPFYAVVLLCLASCRSGARSEAFALTAPPVVPQDGPGASSEVAKDGSQTTTSSASSEPVDLRVALSHSSYSASAPERLVAKIDLFGRARTASTRQPLNLALVFDRSGSMAEDQKFTHALRAAQLAVENLSDRDIVSLVAFNQDAVVLSPAGRAVNKEFLRHRLGEFSPEGWTNLSAGLLEGLAQIDSQGKADQLKQIIVLTDGLANRGVTDPDKLRKLAASANQRGIGISTLGVGTKFDEKLLTALAEAGGGRYTYVASPEQIPTAVAAELRGLLDVVAQNARLELRLNPGRIKRIYGRLLDAPVPSYTFDLGDIRAGERSILLVELAPTALAAGGVTALDVALTFDDPDQGARRRFETRQEARFAESADQIRTGEKPEVVVCARLCDAMEKAEEALEGLDIERFRELTRTFDALYEQARRLALDSRDQEMLNETFLLKHFMTDLAAASQESLLHGHDEAKRRIQKDVDYRRYLLEHHRGGGQPHR